MAAVMKLALMIGFLALSWPLSPHPVKTFPACRTVVYDGAIFGILDPLTYSTGPSRTLHAFARNVKSGSLDMVALPVDSIATH
jgi:hypothetical protein